MDKKILSLVSFIMGLSCFSGVMASDSTIRPVCDLTFVNRTQSPLTITVKGTLLKSPFVLAADDVRSIDKSVSVLPKGLLVVGWRLLNRPATFVEQLALFKEVLSSKKFDYTAINPEIERLVPQACSEIDSLLSEPNVEAKDDSYLNNRVPTFISLAKLLLSILDHPDALAHDNAYNTFECVIKDQRGRTCSCTCKRIVTGCDLGVRALAFMPIVIEEEGGNLVVATFAPEEFSEIGNQRVRVIRDEMQSVDRLILEI